MKRLGRGQRLTTPVGSQRHGEHATVIAPATAAFPLSALTLGGVNASTVVLTTTKAIATVGGDYVSGFRINSEGSDATISSATLQGNQTELRFVLSAPLVPGDRAFLTYDTNVGKLKDTAGSHLVSLLPKNLTNQLAHAITGLSTLTLWADLDASALGLTNGAAVATLTDAGPNHTDATQGTGSYQPIFTTGGPNGLGYLHFDGTKSLLCATGTLSTYTLFIVERTTAGLGADAVVWGDRGSSFYFSHRYKSLVSSSPRMYGSGELDFDATHHVWNVIAIVVNGAGSKVLVNGRWVYTGSVSASIANGFQLGCYGGGRNALWTGDLGEVAIFAGAASDADLRQVSNYYRNKWNLAPHELSTHYMKLDNHGYDKDNNWIKRYESPGIDWLTSDNKLRFIGRQSDTHTGGSNNQVLHASDDGVTWTNGGWYVNGVLMTGGDGGGGRVPSTGTILIPIKAVGNTPTNFYRSVDSGQTWVKGANLVTLNDYFFPQGHVQQLPSGKLMAAFYCINGDANAHYPAWFNLFAQFSTDDGITWGNEVLIASSGPPTPGVPYKPYTEHHPLVLDGDADATTRIITVARCNASSGTAHFDGSIPVAYALQQFTSLDGGQTWSGPIELESLSRYISTNGNSDAQPDLFKLPGGKVGLSWSNRIETGKVIRYAIAASYDDAVAGNWGQYTDIARSGDYGAAPAHEANDFGTYKVFWYGDLAFATYSDADGDSQDGTEATQPFCLVPTGW